MKRGALVSFNFKKLITQNLKIGTLMQKEAGQILLNLFYFRDLLIFRE